MPYIPPSVAESPLAEELAHSGLQRVHQGKVRDTYVLPGQPDLLLVVATDRVSIFDFVLGALVLQKGEVLTALTVYFITQVLWGFKHHLVGYGDEIDRYLPAALKRFGELQRRALVVKKGDMMPVECVVRGVLTGSAWEKYQTGRRMLWGYRLPEGLHDGSWLDQPMFTPTDKAEVGHDDPVTREFVSRTYGPEFEELSIRLFDRIRQHARQKGVIFADTKYEFDKSQMLCDEVATPDSSRYWDVEEYNEAQKQNKAPAGFDKQPVREWGKQAKSANGTVVNISKIDAKSRENQVLVGDIPVPKEVLEACTARYLTLTKRLTGRDIAIFQKQEMCIAG